MLLVIDRSTPHLHMSHLGQLDSAAAKRRQPKATIKPQLEHPLLSSQPMATIAIASPSRPKLSLKTSSLPSPYTKSTSALAIATSAIEAATPTLSNTIANIHQRDILLCPSPSTDDVPKPQRLVSSRPYTQPFNLRSILKNSILHKIESPFHSAPVTSRLGKRSYSLFSADTASPQATRRVFFPPAKTVRFEKEGRLVVEIGSRKQVDDVRELKLEGDSVRNLEKVATAETNSGGKEVGKEDDVGDPDVVAGALDVEKSLDLSMLQDESLSARRGRNGTPAPRSFTPTRRKRPRNWEWTLGSPS